MQNETLQNIKKLREEISKLRRKYTDADSMAKLDEWELALDDLGSAASVRDHSIIKAKVERAKAQADAVTHKLLTGTSEFIPDKVRDGLVAQLDCYNDFVGTFLDIDEEVKGVAKEIGTALERMEIDYAE